MNKYLQLLSDRKFYEAEIERRGEVPKKLIKFFSLGDDKHNNELKFSTLKNEMLWFSSAKQLNDPYEFSCMYVDHERLEQHGYDEYILGKFDEIVGKQQSNFAVVSLSGNDADCLPMWAYYSNNHQGFCVEYEVLKPDLIYRVGYEPSRIPIATIIANFFDTFFKFSKTGMIDETEAEFYGRILMQQFFLKHESWKHEKEYRVIHDFDGGLGISVAIADIGLRTTRIITGLNCADDHKEKLNDISNQLGCGNISITQISGNDFTLIKEL